MNQHVPSPARQSLVNETPLRALRRVAALAGCHHAMIHRLGPEDAPMRNLAVLHNWRDAAVLALPLSALIDRRTLESLRRGACVVPFAIAEPVPRALIRAHGTQGVSLPFHNASGVHAALTLVDSAVTLSPQRIDSLRLAAGQLLTDVFSAPRGAAETALAQREIDCLQWSAAGKTSVETGTILGLSPHTVNQHLASAGAKLGAVNRTQAVAKAVRLGLIDLSAI
jgi:LuxR family transcriptional regulator, quorum-sensing system regulator BjaR1